MADMISIRTDGTKENTSIVVGEHELKNFSALMLKMNARTEGVSAVVKMPTVVLKKNKEGVARPSVVQQEYNLGVAEEAAKAVETDTYWTENAEAADEAEAEKED